MKKTLLFYQPRELSKALELRTKNVLLRSAKGFGPHDYEPAEHVQALPDAHAAVAAVYATHGVEVERVGDDGPALPDGYSIEQKGTWFRLVGPDGQVGKAQRSAEEAAAQLET